ncbi:MAG: NAD(P)/FAD-dependent oxidoreductase, partial [Bacteroidota bacterium]
SGKELTYVIIGAGAAGTAAAQAMRDAGFEGRIVMLTYEDKLPYDRPSLSKSFMKGESPKEWLPLKDEDFYRNNRIEIKKRIYVDRIDKQNNSLYFSDGGSLTYHKLLIATGGRPVTPDIPGKDLENVFTLRSYEDTLEIIETAKHNKKAVIIGSSFIGMETASSLGENKVDVTVVAPEELPFEKVFGKEIGEFFLKKHKEAGTKFKLGQSVKEFRGNGTVKQVILNNGDRLDADMVIFGTGVEPATNFKSGPKTAEDGSFKVDQYFRVDKEIYAAGDIATFIDWRTGEKLRIEHWRTAEQQGMLAGRNMAGAKEQYRSVPFFWTRQAGINLVYVGHATEWDQTKTIGSISKGDFITFYIKKGNILAAAGMGRAKQMDAIHELMRIDKMPSPDEIKEETDFVELVK